MVMRFAGVEVALQEDYLQEKDIVAEAPSELSIYLAEFLDAKSLAIASEVSTTWNSVFSTSIN